jgi:hypothetical protein
MKMNELINSFEIFTTNEEKDLLGKIDARPHPISSYTEREQTIINNMVKKSLVSKVRDRDLFLVLRND